MKRNIKHIAFMLENNTLTEYTRTNKTARFPFRIAGVPAQKWQNQDKL
jgi:hypothetical protein